MIVTLMIPLKRTGYLLSWEHLNIGIALSLNYLMTISINSGKGLGYGFWRSMGYVLWQSMRHYRRRLPQSWLYKYMPPIYNIMRERQSLTEWGEREPISVFDIAQYTTIHDPRSSITIRLNARSHTKPVSRNLENLKKVNTGTWAIRDMWLIIITVHDTSLSVISCNFLSQCSLGDKSKPVKTKKKKSSSNQIPLKIK